MMHFKECVWSFLSSIGSRVHCTVAHGLEFVVYEGAQMLTSLSALPPFRICLGRVDISSTSPRLTGLPLRLILNLIVLCFTRLCKSCSWDMTGLWAMRTKERVCVGTLTLGRWAWNGLYAVGWWFCFVQRQKWSCPFWAVAERFFGSQRFEVCHGDLFASQTVLLILGCGTSVVLVMPCTWINFTKTPLSLLHGTGAQV